MAKPTEIYAFPRPENVYYLETSGMTLRDYFAAHAPVPANMSWNNRANLLGEEVEYRYKYADAMLAERAKKNN